MLDIKKLNISYQTDDGKVRAVRNVDLELKENTSYGIVGESGSGKSTLAMGILRLLPPNVEEDGQIIYKGVDLLSLSPKQMKDYRWTDLAVVFQESMNSFSPVHRIRSQFEDIYHVHYPKVKKQEIRKQVLELFDKFNLDEKVYDSYPHELSGGMAQRVSIVLSLILQPKILIMDEATTALDLINEGQILDLIRDLEKNINLTRINISHDISIVHSSCDEVIVMYGGHIFEKGKVNDVFQKPYHPYTKALLDSYPDISRFKEQISPIPGSLADLKKEYKGCIYFDRCPNKKDICSKKEPRVKTDKDRAYYCHNPLGGGSDYFS
ncbi:ABC transporter ATP-binding protein [Anaerococcus sp. ENR0831]|uniref:ABC transporter ATP-binding protein n=1 Tax=Anaerococcus martiniensis TaxID=3115615 RepID=A0ABW9M7J3_9FIRM